MRHMPYRHAVLVLAFLASWAGHAAGQQAAERAAPPASPVQAEIEMNFQNVEISNFLNTMSRAFGIPFVWDDQAVRGRITLQSIRKYSRDDAYRLFETVLAMQGFTTVQSPGSPVVQVVPLADAARLPTPINPEVSAALAGNVFVTRIITLRHADPEEVKSTIAPLMSKSAASAAYSPAGALILADTEENLKRYQQIIDQLDVPPGESEFAVIPLQYASARRLAPILSSLVADVPEKGQTAPKPRSQPAAPRGARKPIILADERTNMLIVSADPADVGAIRRLVQVLDIPAAFEEGGFKIYPLKHASAVNLAKILRDVNQGTSGSSAQRPRKEGETAPERAPVVVTADRPTNALIVFAPPEVIETFDRLVEALDIPGRADEASFKIYQLKYAAADDMARILQQFKQTGTAPPVRERGERAEKPEEGAGAAAGAAVDVIIAADRPTNSLIVFAPPEILLTFDRLVAALDVSGRIQESLFKTYRLQYAAAAELAKLLQDVKRVAETGGPEARPKAGGGAQTERQAQDTSVVVVTADVPTNTLIVFGPPQVIQTFDRLVAELDVPGRIQPSTFKVYRLQHASAEDLAKVLGEVREGAEVAGQEPAQTQSRTQSARTPAAGRTGTTPRLPELNITADKATNSLIVFGTPDQITTMDAIVQQLDIRRPQVYVEALIMEMTLEKSLQLGINWQASARVGDAVVGGGFPNAAPQTLPDVLGQGQGAALGIIGDEIEFQGQKFTSFGAFIQATRQDLDLNILANPQILTLDNEEAEINVSQVIPVSAKVVRDANLQTTTEFEFKDVGVILSITPQITGQDKVLLTIKQESSSVAAQQVQTSQNQTAITTLKRTINSKVLIDNGATMAIGGLIQDNQIQTVSKVPCLGDIPVLGWFFKSRSEGVRKTNLIVFLRPHVINTREDLERISSGAQSRYDASREPDADVEGQLRESFNLPQRSEPSAEGEGEPAQQ
jgi:general secretion pathway protein D